VAVSEPRLLEGSWRGTESNASYFDSDAGETAFGQSTPLSCDQSALHLDSTEAVHALRWQFTYTNRW